MIFRRLLIVACVLLLLGCVPDYESDAEAFPPYNSESGNQSCVQSLGTQMRVCKDNGFSWLGDQGLIGIIDANDKIVYYCSCMNQTVIEGELVTTQKLILINNTRYC